MADMQHFIDRDIQFFEWSGISDPATPVTTAHWEPWNKSWVRGATFLDVFLVGAGGGGCSGLVKAIGAAGGGGGGGGSGGIACGRFVLDRLPETLYFYIPSGGRGGVGSNVSGGTGARAYMGINTASTAAAGNDILLVSGSANAGGGTNAGAGGATAAGSTVAASTDARIGSYLAVCWNSTAGVAGGSGGVQGGQNGVVAVVTALVTGGGGGGGSTSADFAGGDVPAIGERLNIPGGSAGSNPGKPGYWVRENSSVNWSTSGGSGGGSSNSTTGGDAGDAGGPGSGGGGGGAGITTSGRGGNGGDAYLFMVAS